jgi:hypothetical protein
MVEKLVLNVLSETALALVLADEIAGSNETASPPTSATDANVLDVLNFISPTLLWCQPAP